jgi:hypothetical protein
MQPQVLQLLVAHAGWVHALKQINPAEQFLFLPLSVDCCRYLIAMQPQDLQLLVAHAGWVLAADPEAGLEALLAMNPPLKPDLVMLIMQVSGSYVCGFIQLMLVKLIQIESV